MPETHQDQTDNDGLLHLFASTRPLSITAAFAAPEDDDYYGHDFRAAHDEEPCPTCGDYEGDHHGPQDCPYGGCEPGEHCPWECPYETGYTNWDHVYPHLPDTMHRGMSLRLGHDFDPAAPPHAMARAIAENLREYGSGTHWTPHEHMARHYTAVSHRNGDDLHVILHAAKPHRDDIEEDPHELLKHDVIGFGEHADAEIPLQRGAHIHLTGISYRRPGENAWTRHDFKQPMEHRALLEHTAGGKPWLPHDRFFGPGHRDLDPRLFDGTHLKPAWRHALLKLVAKAFTAYGPTYVRWAKAYLAGSQASHWYGNDDLDVLIGVDYDAFRRLQPRHRAMSDRQIDDMLNADAHRLCDPARWFTIGGQHLGPFDSTLYVNPDSYDIRRIKPYAAYDLNEDRWAVEPVEVPDDFGPDKLPSADFLYARSLASQVRALRKLPAGQAQALGAALYDKLHAERHDAFSDHGGGLYDARNIAWKYLALHPERPMEHLVAWKRAEQAGSGLATKAVYEHPALPNPEAEDWSNRHARDDEWFHGTQAMFDHPQVNEAEQEDGEGKHWNTALGTHWTSRHDVVNALARGQLRNQDYDDDSSEWGARPAAEGMHAPRIFHARLHLKNPKHYESEFDMDREAYAHEYERGNEPKIHDPEHPEFWEDHPWIGAQDGLRKLPDKGPLPYGKKIGDTRGRFQNWLSFHPDRYGIAQRFKQRLIDAGHDGIVYGNEYEKAGEEGAGHVSAIAFHPRQVEITQVHGAFGPRGCLRGHELDEVRHPRPGQPALPGMRSGYPDERWESGLEHLGGMNGPGSDATFAKSSVMIALVPPRQLAEKLVVDKGEPVDQLHVTLAYIPHVDPDRLGQLTGTVAEWASRQRPITATVQGLGTFVNDGEHPLWAAVDIPGSSHLHSSLVDALRAAKFEPSDKHGFTAHMTLSYNKYHVRFLPKKIVPESFTCHSVYVCRGDNWRPVPLSGATAGKVG